MTGSSMPIIPWSKYRRPLNLQFQLAPPGEYLALKAWRLPLGCNIPNARTTHIPLMICDIMTRCTLSVKTRASQSYLMYSAQDNHCARKFWKSWILLLAPIFVATFDWQSFCLGPGQIFILHPVQVVRDTCQLTVLQIPCQLFAQIVPRASTCHGWPAKNKAHPVDVHAHPDTIQSNNG